MAKKKKESWIKLSRSLMDNDLWYSEPFTRSQAWIDLLMLAAYEDTDILYDGKAVHLERGQLWTSVRFLAKRWNRSKNWVAGTLRTLKSLKMVTLSGTQTGTLITIEKYAFYQGGRDTKRDTNEDTKKDTTRDKDKEIKNIYINNIGGGAENDDISAAAEEERYVKIRSQDGRTFIYDTKEERYVN